MFWNQQLLHVGRLSDEQRTDGGDVLPLPPCCPLGLRHPHRALPDDAALSRLHFLQRQPFVLLPCVQDSYVPGRRAKRRSKGTLLLLQ